MEAVPEWLTAPERYVPPADRDRFLDKSILSFIGLLSRIRQQSGRTGDSLWVSPAFKLLFTVLEIVLISSARHFTFVWLMLAWAVVVLALLPARDIRRCLRGALIGAAFAYIVLLPAALGGSRYSITMIPAKVFACVLLANLLSSSTRWDHLIGALKRFRFRICSFSSLTSPSGTLSCWASSRCSCSMPCACAPWAGTAASTAPSPAWAARCSSNPGT